MQDPDIVVIGSGPNGLVLANRLARSGYSVLVLEANAERPGGALGSAALTLPGFLHDVGAAFFPFIPVSPAFAELELQRFGLQLTYAPVQSAHPALDGSDAHLMLRDAASQLDLGNAADTQNWLGWVDWFLAHREQILQLLLSPIPNLNAAWQLGPWQLVRLLRLLLPSPRAFAERWFSSTSAQRVLPGLGLHADLPPDTRCGSGVGGLLGLLAATSGFGIPVGGAQTITNALVTAFEQHGGKLRLGARVKQILVHGGRASAVRLENGDEIKAKRAIAADTSAPALFLELLNPDLVAQRILRHMRQFEQGWATFKLDWALGGPVPWRSEAARRAATIHVAENLADLADFSHAIQSGQLPEQPYLVLGQQSLFDPHRAPEGFHTLYGYTHVPHWPSAAWPAQSRKFADRIEARIEALAPGFRDLVLARRLTTPPEFEANNANLRAGDLAGGTAHWRKQLIFRPIFPHFRYRMPIQGLYLCSSYTHPGPGVHGMCGHNASQQIIRDCA